MSTFDVLVEVTLREGISDPQGATIERALPALGFESVSGVHVGKAFRFTIEAPDQPAAEGAVEELCKRFLTNPVIEDSTITASAPFRSRSRCQSSSASAKRSQARSASTSSQEPGKRTTPNFTRPPPRSPR